MHHYLFLLNFKHKLKYNLVESTYKGKRIIHIVSDIEGRTSVGTIKWRDNREQEVYQRHQPPEDTMSKEVTQLRMIKDVTSMMVNLGKGRDKTPEKRSPEECFCFVHNQISFVSSDISNMGLV